MELKRKRNEWISEIYSLFEKNKQVLVRIDEDVKSTIVTVETKGTGKFNTVTKGSFGRAYCKRTDTFDKKFGIALAYARYCGYSIPKFMIKDVTILNDIDDGIMFLFNGRKYVRLQKIGYKIYVIDAQTGQHYYFSLNAEVEIKNVFSCD